MVTTVREYVGTYNTERDSFKLTSSMKMSKILVAIGKGKNVRKIVRNQEDAYMEVWKF